MSASIGHLDIIVSGVMVISQRIITNILSGLIIGASITSSAISQVASTATRSAKSKSVLAASAALTSSTPTARAQNGNLNLSENSSVTRGSTSTADSSDEALISLICGGETEALACLFRRYVRVVRVVAYRVLRDPSEADDLLQDIFLLIQRKCTMFDASRGPARFWILQMTYHRAIARRRYLTSRHFYTRVDLDDAERDLASPANGCLGTEAPGDGLLENAGLKRIFEALSQDQRETLQLFFVEGYTLAEIATKLNQTRGNVKHHYFRGLEKLRKQFFDSKLQGNSAV